MKFSFIACLSLAAITSASPLVPRGQPTCKNLQAASNNGDRKIGIVIDSSGSMADTDPDNLRLVAGRAVNDWLITSKEASGSKKEDLVTVVSFSDVASLLYPLGDPSGADSVFSQIGADGGTFIAGGVDMASSELTKSGHGATANRSGIVVFTDGEDSDTITLVESINNCSSLGIRVSFGFLTYDASFQDPSVLTAILDTGGMYATIDGATAQNSFVNLMLVHGLTDDDNPSTKDSSTLVNGLSLATALSGSDSTLIYSAQANERLTFTITSVTAGDLDVTANDANGKQLGKTSVFSNFTNTLVVKAATSGDMKLQVATTSEQVNGLFIIGVNSSIPIENCTLAQSDSGGGLTAGAKAGIGISVPLILGLIGAGSFFLWKYWKGIPTTGSSPPAYTPGQPQMDPTYKHPMVQTSPAMPTPQPTNTHPGWAMPPPVHPPGKGGKPGKDGDPNQPQNDGNNPQNYNQSDPPNQTDPSQQQPNYNQPDPSHPNQADPSHPAQADPSHPNQVDPSHPNQADPSHPNQYDPSHPNQADPSHPNQADPPPNHNGTDPSQPGQNPTQNPPHNPHHPHRLPRFRLFGRRKKSDEQQQQQQPQYVPAGNVAVVGGAVSPPQQYSGTATIAGGVVAPQAQQYAAPVPQQQVQQYAAPVSQPQVQQYAAPMSQPQVQQYSAPVSAMPPQQPHNVSPLLQHAELASPVDGTVISPVGPPPIHRRPVGEAELQN
ncbi:hypothetical protein AOQ84DRAFT_325997 [Glonium stellatum]|uniref:VWFA domain-containing protein n=1 Tax=Glonium stellatum TaxID=574774 RepID=A0A8E2ERK7_9PEZI|nr:hypothetical protein AOQ84DRAFT_325997 [Glonium stellatum]